MKNLPASSVLAAVVALGIKQSSRESFGGFKETKKKHFLLNKLSRTRKSAQFIPFAVNIMQKAVSFYSVGLA